nr:nucleotide exchange factor GrpE [Clostridia bacterium]
MEEKKAKKKNESAEETEKLQAELAEAKKSADEFKDKWMRSVAEFDNYKKRNAKIWQDAFNEGIASVILKILVVGDTLDRALSLGLDEKTQAGLQGIKRKFDDTLISLEIEEINPVGEVFDPNIAEAVMQVEKGEDDKSDTVKQVFEKGYRLKDKIIRYAKVSVVK